jgi:hypothetical protein
MPYKDRDGAFWALLGSDVDLRCTPYNRALIGEYEYPRATRQEAAEYFESIVRE